MSTATTLAAGDLAIDRELARVSDSFRFLLDLTPVDVEPNRDAFLRGEQKAPSFTYRQLEDEPDVLRTVLDDIAVGDVQDHTFGHLLRAKHRELVLQLDMLGARGSQDFLPLSIELYGTVAPGLLSQAESLLSALEPPAAAARGERLDAAGFVQLAEAELAHYRAVDPDIGVHVEIRPDASGIMVSGRDLIVGSSATVPVSRAHAVLQHEVGTHLLTYVNGTYQPIRVLAAGLAGYEETQEGLAVLAEHLVDGLSTFRLRQLAARVVAVHEMVTGRSFAEVHERLVEAGFPPGSAFTTTMRSFRAGGLTKDAIYLRGLLGLLEHLADGGTLDLLWLGKLSLEDLPLVGELADRGAIHGPRLLPRYPGGPGHRLTPGAGGGADQPCRADQERAMRIGFVVNDVQSEKAVYTTTRLALTATQMGHEVWYTGVGDFTYEPDGALSARLRSASKKQYKSLERYLADVQGGDGTEEQARLDELDVVLLRSDPADDAIDRPWAVTAGVAFGQLTSASGAFVMNDPCHLAHALNKAYFQHFPEAVRPRTLISRDEAAISSFVAEQGGKAVLKPLQGSGGSGVFLVSDEESPNLNQIIEAISRDGYVVAQEYLPEAEQGDVRVFVMNGNPLEHNGQIAAFRRVNEGPDLRSNMSVGGRRSRSR